MQLFLLFLFYFTVNISKLFYRRESDKENQPPQHDSSIKNVDTPSVKEVVSFTETSKKVSNFSNIIFSIPFSAIVSANFYYYNSF